MAEWQIHNGTSPPGGEFSKAASSASAAAPIALVTGAGGFIAGHMIEQLLGRGYSVRATVRTLADTLSYKHLHKLVNAEQSLTILEADLVKPEGWSEAFEGDVRYVFHCAGPFVLKHSENAQRELYEPFVSGTRTILEHCEKNLSIKKVVLTSCYATLSDEFTDRLHDETNWNTTSTMERNPYHYSKTEQERLAWEYAKHPQCHYKLITILPGLVLGPHLNPDRISQSHKMLLAFISKYSR
jgi:dihydroflavonol-4-reductase